MNKEYFESNKAKMIYLEALRFSGLTNMYGAGSYVERAFGISKIEAREALSFWMKNYDEIKELIREIEMIKLNNGKIELTEEAKAISYDLVKNCTMEKIDNFFKSEVALNELKRETNNG